LGGRRETACVSLLSPTRRTLTAARSPASTYGCFLRVSTPSCPCATPKYLIEYVLSAPPPDDDDDAGCAASPLVLR
jgi:hypothetical protein